jgi:hypothetical protein
VIIIGMHNPPINPAGNEYPHFFRETERPNYDAGQLNAAVEHYLMRQNTSAIVSGHDSWSRSGTRYFKRGSSSDCLDFGNGTGSHAVDFLKLCSDKRVDAVLCGHVHQQVEFRTQPDGNGGFFYFMDFYTENPKRYRESFDWFYRNGNPVPVRTGDLTPIHIVVEPGAKPDTPPKIVRHNSPGSPTVTSRELAIPPYADPLDKALDKSQWWSRHRPLLIQTSCLGPIDYHQRLEPKNGVAQKRPISLQGVRIVSIFGNEIAGMKSVGIGDIRRKAVPGVGPLHGNDRLDHIDAGNVDVMQ